MAAGLCPRPLICGIICAALQQLEPGAVRLINSRAAAVILPALQPPAECTFVWKS